MATASNNEELAESFEGRNLPLSASSTPLKLNATMDVSEAPPSRKLNLME